MKRKGRLKQKRILTTNKNHRIMHIWKRKRLIKERREVAFTFMAE
ncbi:Uncharacterised protein [Haemophilus parahaemolyticus HK385]|uniref:Uncharacterized protein n=1 Tax=Haemophilus parahaemolyticus HK385 TaxID=1095744 RepID=A0ABP2P434_HAEPH|nr:hypothetical protein HMPREF1050_1373 [Haemophilus parahaemolyticus HK385]STO65456.1 Uncharacterised protein [Haemophilus parahaemolyticus HK385]